MWFFFPQVWECVVLVMLSWCGDQYTGESAVMLQTVRWVSSDCSTEFLLCIFFYRSEVSRMEESEQLRHKSVLDELTADGINIEGETWTELNTIHRPQHRFYYICDGVSFRYTFRPDLWILRPTGHICPPTTFDWPARIHSKGQHLFICDRCTKCNCMAFILKATKWQRLFLTHCIYIVVCVYCLYEWIESVGEIMGVWVEGLNGD